MRCILLVLCVLLGHLPVWGQGQYVIPPEIMKIVWPNGLGSDRWPKDWPQSLKLPAEVEKEQCDTILSGINHEFSDSTLEGVEPINGTWTAKPKRSRLPDLNVEELMQTEQFAGECNELLVFGGRGSNFLFQHYSAEDVINMRLNNQVREVSQKEVVRRITQAIRQLWDEERAAHQRQLAAYEQELNQLSQTLSLISSNLSVLSSHPSSSAWQNSLASGQDQIRQIQLEEERRSREIREGFQQWMLLHSLDKIRKALER